MLTAGTFHQEEERILRDVHDGTNAVVVGLEHDKYRRLIVEAPDPKETVQLIENVLRR